MMRAILGMTNPADQITKNLARQDINKHLDKPNSFYQEGRAELHQIYIIYGWRPYLCLRRIRRFNPGAE